jgi:hypothetical protein
LQKEHKATMAEQANATSQQCAEVNSLNSKLAYDFSAQLQNQGLMDNQSDARAWQEVKLTAARDAQTLKYLAAVNNLTADQTGATENQQNVSPIGQAVAEALKAVPGVAAGDIAAGIANLNSSLIPVIATAVGTITAQTVAAVLPALVTAIGGASTPSQTQPKSTPTGAN